MGFPHTGKGSFPRLAQCDTGRNPVYPPTTPHRGGISVSLVAHIPPDPAHHRPYLGWGSIVGIHNAPNGLKTQRNPVSCDLPEWHRGAPPLLRPATLSGGGVSLPADLAEIFRHPVFGEENFMAVAPPLLWVVGMSYKAVRVYWLEETDEWVCRGTAMSRGRCPAGGMHCRAEWVVSKGVGEYPREWPDYRRRGDDTVLRCEQCRRVIVLPVVSGSMVRMYRDTRNGALVDLGAAEPGAMWDAKWCSPGGTDRGYRGADGISLCVKCPNGHNWFVDSQASNCTKPQREDAMGAFTRSHYCWVRHGDPRNGTVHVDKAGATCAAGAGSIIAGDYHGFLHYGWLTAG